MNGVQHQMRRPTGWHLRCFPIPDSSLWPQDMQGPGGSSAAPFSLSLLESHVLMSWRETKLPPGGWVVQSPSLSIILVFLDQPGSGNTVGQESGKKRKKKRSPSVGNKKEKVSISLLALFWLLTVFASNMWKTQQGQVVPHQRCIEINLWKSASKMA